jgi:hypothetical protein
MFTRQDVCLGRLGNPVKNLSGKTRPLLLVYCLLLTAQTNARKLVFASRAQFEIL